MREKGRQGDGDCNRFLGSSARCDNDRRTLHNIRAPSDYARPPAVRSDSSQLHKTQLTSYFVAGESEGRERRRDEGGGEELLSGASTTSMAAAVLVAARRLRS